MTALRGVYTAIATPFGRDGAVDLKMMEPLLAWQRAMGVDGVVICGTNGEGPSMSVAERMALLEAVVGIRGGKGVIAGTGAAALPDTLALTRHAAAAGADACLVLPPFYFPQPSEQGVIDAFRRVLDAAELPVLLYSIPQVTGIAVTDGMLDALQGHPQLAGLKESSGKWPRIEVLLRERTGLVVLPGADQLVARSLAAGAPGVISGSANAFPDLAAAVERAHTSGGDVGAAQERLSRGADLLLRYPPYAGNKHVLARRGAPRMWVRPPMVELTVDQARSLDADLDAMGIPPAA